MIMCMVSDSYTIYIRLTLISSPRRVHQPEGENYLNFSVKYAKFPKMSRITVFLLKGISTFADVFIIQRVWQAKRIKK